MNDFRNVLDDGFVKLTQFAGGDIHVVNGARISFHRQHKEMEEGDDKLINFLMRERHGTPFENSWFSFHIRCPIFVAREWMRHRISSFNEVSGRYVKLDQTYYVPEGDAIRYQTGKPGAYKYLPMQDPAKEHAIRSEILRAYKHCENAYESLLAKGVAKEVARIVVPVGLYTEFIYAANARSLMNFLSLRNADSAMYEIRQYAIQIEKIFAKKMPATAKCFIENNRVAP